MGSKLAGEIEMSIPDMLRYLYYLPDKLKERHGDFGVNAQRVNEVFNEATPRSVIFLNALYDGTAPEEVIRHSFEMLQAFNKIGCNTLYVTHNHPVVSKLEEHGFTRCLQTDWEDGRPLFKLKPGIALTSHAEAVLHYIGADLPAIEHSLRERGYLGPEESLVPYKE
jgi:DNA mismatch repair ATPase MutS